MRVYYKLKERLGIENGKRGVTDTEVFKLADSSRGPYRPHEFAQSLSILLFAREGRENSRLPWLSIAYDASESGDLEICREIVIRAIKECRKENVRKSLIPITKESADENIADIMGMIVDEECELFEDALQNLDGEIKISLGESYYDE